MSRLRSGAPRRFHFPAATMALANGIVERRFRWTARALQGSVQRLPIRDPAAPADDARPIPAAGDHLRRSVVAAKQGWKGLCDGSRTRYRKIMSLVLYQ